jgi:hypothetical protein
MKFCSETLVFTSLNPESAEHLSRDAAVIYGDNLVRIRFRYLGKVAITVHSCTSTYWTSTGDVTFACLCVRKFHNQAYIRNSKEILYLGVC